MRRYAPDTAPDDMRRATGWPLSPLPDPESLLGSGRSLSDPLQLSHADAGVARDDAIGAQDGAIGGAGVSFATLLHLVQRKFEALGQPHLLFGARVPPHDEPISRVRVSSGVISGVSSAGGVISPTERNAERVECGAGSRPASLGMRVISGGVISGGVISRRAGSQPASLGMRRTTGTIWLLMT